MTDIYKNSSAMIFIVVIVAIVFGFLNFKVVDFETGDSTLVWKLLLALIFIALVIERAVEVLLNNKFGEDELVARRPVRLAKAKVELLDETVQKRALVEMNGSTDETLNLMMGEMAKANDDLEKAREDLVSAYKKAQPLLESLYIEKRSLANNFSLGIGVLVAAAGVRILENLVTSASLASIQNIGESSFSQYSLFLILDIFITATLLAGGAEGIHQIMKRFLAIKNDITP